MCVTKVFLLKMFAQRDVPINAVLLGTYIEKIFFFLQQDGTYSEME